MEVNHGDARGRGMRWVEVGLVPTSPPEVTRVFGACRGASRPVLGPELRATRRPETQVLPRFPASAPPGTRTPNLLIKSHRVAGYEVRQSASGHASTTGVRYPYRYPASEPQPYQGKPAASLAVGSSSAWVEAVSTQSLAQFAITAPRERRPTCL